MKAEEFPQEARRLRPVLVAIALDILGDRDEAEDIVQDVLLKLWTLCPQLRMPVDKLASVVTVIWRVHACGAGALSAILPPWK